MAIRRSYVGAFLVVSGVALVTAGCRRTGKQAEETRTEPAAPPVVPLVPSSTLTTPLDGGTPLVTAAIPDDFPREIPIYAGARVVFGAKSTAQGHPAWTVTLETRDPRGKVVDFYKANLTALHLATSMDTGDTSMAVWQGPKYDTTLMAKTEPDQQTSFTLTAAGK